MMLFAHLDSAKVSRSAQMPAMISTLSGEGLPSVCDKLPDLWPFGSMGGSSIKTESETEVNCVLFVCAKEKRNTQAVPFYWSN